MTTFAFVFPGQGSQAVGMLDAWGDLACVRQTLEEASDVLGQDIAALIAKGPKEALDLTINTQPVMLVAAVAAWRAWQQASEWRPVALAGHSLGEYSALVAAEVLSLADALRLVRHRAKAMQEAVPAGLGAMAAVLGMEAQDVAACCQEDAAQLGQAVEAVNFNAPAQVVIAGSKAAVGRACDIAKAKGAKRALPLPVSAPFHSSLLKPASDRLQAYLAGVAFAAPQIPLINNVDVAVVSDPAAIRDALVRQAAAPVRWVETVQKMAADGVTHLVECGPGKVLTGLTKRINGELVGEAIVDQESLDKVLELLK